MDDSVIIREMYGELKGHGATLQRIENHVAQINGTILEHSKSITQLQDRPESAVASYAESASLVGEHREMFGAYRVAKFVLAPGAVVALLVYLVEKFGG